MKIGKSDTDLNPAGNIYFEKVNKKYLGKKETVWFHTSVERGMFVAKRAISDIHQTVAVFQTEVK